MQLTRLLNQLAFIGSIAVCIFLSGCSFNYKEDVSIPAVIKAYHPGTSPYAYPDKKIVLMGGCFDVLHYGHVDYLKKAKAQGDLLIVALEPDESIIRYKRRNPIHTMAERAENLAAIRYVDMVLLLPPLNGFKDYNQLVKDVNPNVIAIAANDTQKINKKKQADAIGAELKVVVESVNSFSSSKIIKSLSD